MSTIKVNAIQHTNGANVAMSLAANGSVTFPNTAVFSSSVVSSIVGIGTSSPAYLLDIDQATGDAQNFRLKNEEVALFLGTYGTGSSYPREVTINGSRADAGSLPNLRIAGQGGIKFCVDFNTERMLIDSSGRVTMPYQPSFQVAKDDGGASLAGGQTILWNVISHNIGGNYNASTGRFTAPVTGRYYFSAFMLFGAGGTDTGQTFVFYINGSSSGYQPYTRTTGAAYVGMAGSVVLSLNAGDYVTVYIDTGPVYATGAKHNGFSGYLLG